MKTRNGVIKRLLFMGVVGNALLATGHAAVPVVAKKNQKMAAAMIEALIKQTAASRPEAATQDFPVQEKIGEKKDSADTAKVLIQAPPASQIPDRFDHDVVIGSATQANKLAVYGDVRVGGSVIAGAIAADRTSTGIKHIMGVTRMNPRTQQFEIIFKTKSNKQGNHTNGAFVSLDFVTSSTIRIGMPDSGTVTTVVHMDKVYCHPDMSAQQIMGLTGVSSKDMKSTTTSFTVNAPARTAVFDFNLTPTVRVEALTRNIAFGFVPYSSLYPVATGLPTSLGFYEVQWHNANGGVHPEWSEGTLSYQIASDDVARVEVVNSVADEIIPVDIFELFNDQELAALLALLQEYFGEDTNSMRDYLMKNRHMLSRMFRSGSLI